MSMAFSIVKRAAKLIIGLTLSISITVGMFSAGEIISGKNHEPYSETFKGYVSTSSYTTEEDTVTAFLNNEIAGATSSPEYERFEKRGELTADEIDHIKTDLELDFDIESGERISIFYRDGERSKSVKTNLLYSNEAYRYYIELQDNDEPLTNSYFDTVLDGKKYLNCTSVTTLGIKITSPEAITDSTYLQTIMFDDDLAFFDQNIPGYDTDMYFEQGNGSIKVYLEHPARNDGVIMSLDEINSSSSVRYAIYLTKGTEQVWLSDLSTLEEVTDFMFMMDLDASYFVKTSYGFCMPEEKYKEVCRLLLGYDSYDQFMDEWEEHQIHFHSDYYVSEGRLSASSTVLTMINGDELLSININVKYTDFGTTVVEHPLNSKKEDE